VITIHHQVLHVFRTAIPTVAMNAMQNLALIAKCPLWRFVWHITDLRILHHVCRFPFLHPSFPMLNLDGPFELDFPVFDSDVWTHILAFSEQSLSSHIWHSCPPLQSEAFSEVATSADGKTKTVFPWTSVSVESRQSILSTCSHGLPAMGSLDFSLEQPLPWKLSSHLFRTLFLSWSAHTPDGLQPLFDLFPVQLSCVISRSMSPQDLPFDPSNCLLTGSQFIFYWLQAAEALGKLQGDEPCHEYMAEAFDRLTVLDSTSVCHSTRPHIQPLYCGQMLPSLISLTYFDYLTFLQPSLGAALAELREFLLGYSSSLRPPLTDYLSAVYHGHIQESYLDPVFHYYLLGSTGLATRFPDIFPRHFPPVDWTCFFPPSHPSTLIQPFEPPFISTPILTAWQRWSTFTTYEDLIKSLGFSDVTACYPLKDGLDLLP
jgi:hypothetical protein